MKRLTEIGDEPQKKFCYDYARQLYKRLQQLENMIAKGELIKIATESEKKSAEESKITDKCHDIQALYNGICTSLAKCSKLTYDRKKHIKNRLDDGYTVEDFEKLFKATQSSKFLCGENGRNWKATFDWLINANNMAKVLDGNYNTNEPTKQHSYDLDELTKVLDRQTPKI